MKPVSKPSQSRIVTGTIIALLGGIGFLLLMLSGDANLPYSIRGPISQNAPMTGLISLVLLIWGMSQLWSASHDTDQWTPRIPGRRFEHIQIYTRSDCPLCDDVTELFARYRKWLPPVEEISIDGDESLTEIYGESIPAVFIDGEPRFRGEVSEILLRRLIDGASPNATSRR